jgi:hypothetical protein
MMVSLTHVTIAGMVSRAHGQANVLFATHRHLKHAISTVAAYMGPIITHLSICLLQ